MTLPDARNRRRVLTELDATLLVEAAAGTGKTSLVAGRIVMLLATGCEPQHIAAITFTELAAGELALRVNSYLKTLLSGNIPKVLELALPRGLSVEQRDHLVAAQQRLDEITTSTIHGFCQDIIRSYAVETGLDPGSRVIDGPGADALFDNVFSSWLIARLSGGTDANDPIVVLSQDDPLGVVKLVRELAELKRKHATATTNNPRFDRRVDVAFVDAVADFERWFAATPGEPQTAMLLEDLQALATLYANCFAQTPDFRRLWQLAHAPHLKSMEAGSPKLSAYRCKTGWKRNCGAEDGERFNAEAEAHFAIINTRYSELLGEVADALVSALSHVLDDVVDAYSASKRNAAALDFDDLLHFAYNLVSNNEAVRKALGERYRHIFVDEFQDTDRVQAAIIFLIAADVRPVRWQEARPRPGSLFLVGDPKQAIYRFRGADIEAYNEARAALTSLAGDNVIAITANFRSQRAIIEHINDCFASALQAPGQPGYVPLAATLQDAVHPLPCAARVTIELPPNPNAADQRNEEAAIVAGICKRLVGALQIKRVDGEVTPLSPGDIALLAPTGTDLWRYEQALEAVGLSVASQAGKTLFRQQETQDILALLRALSDPADTLALGAFLRGPMVGLTDEDLLDIAEAVHASSAAPRPPQTFDIRTPVALVAHPLARSVLLALQRLRGRVLATTPRILLLEAIEQLQLRVILAARHGNRSARALANLDALIELARPYDVAGLRAFVRALQSDWESHAQQAEGRIDPSTDAVELVTIHSSKGLEWPVVIPINTSTTFRQPSQFVHRKSDNSLHWVLGGVTPPELDLARDEESRQEGLERERMLYVACTRARDLLLIPELPAASSKSWSKVLDLRQGSLPPLNLGDLPELAPNRQETPVNEQSSQQFALEAERIVAASPALVWSRPSDHDLDRADILEPAASTVDDAFVLVEPVGAGRLRGVLLHKLMEEFLTGELSDGELPLVVARAAQLLEQLAGMEDRPLTALPDATEMAHTALHTLGLADVAALRPHLVPEVGLWATLDAEHFLAGRADAVAQENGVATVVLDWKSDVTPDQKARADHAGQLSAYLTATGARRGALVYMTPGEIVWLNRS